MVSNENLVVDRSLEVNINQKFNLIIEPLYEDETGFKMIATKQTEFQVLNNNIRHNFPNKGNYYFLIYEKNKKSNIIDEHKAKTTEKLESLIKKHSDYVENSEIIINLNFQIEFITRKTVKLVAIVSKYGINLKNALEDNFDKEFKKSASIKIRYFNYEIIKNNSSYNYSDYNSEDYFTIIITDENFLQEVMSSYLNYCNDVVCIAKDTKKINQNKVKFFTDSNSLTDSLSTYILNKLTK